MTVKSVLWPARLLYRATLIVFLTLLWKGEAGAQNQGVYNQINDLLNHSSSVQDSVRREISRISYLITSSAKNPNFYLNPNWQSSFIITNEERVYHFSGRMNALDNSIEVKLDEEIRTIHPDQLKLVVIGRRTFMPFKGSVIDFTDQRNVYLEVLSHGKVHLLVHYFYRSQSGVNNRLSPNTNGGNFKILPIYYCIQERGEIVRMRTSKRKILSLFGDQKDLVENYAKEHHLHYSDESDLIQIFDYYNSLDQ